MEDISANITQLREATAKAVVRVSQPETILAVIENRVPKGNVLEMAKVAGLFGVKNTALNLPNSHPQPIEFTGIEYEIQDLEIRISVKVKSVCKSDLEMEAMHGASIVALTIYDMLKPIDKGISIDQIKIEEKTGKPKEENQIQEPIKTAVVVCSNAVANGIKADSAGQAILKKLRFQPIQITSYILIPDSLEEIRALATRLSSENQLVIFSGGTGLSSTDVTPEALESLLEKRIPGIEEAIRSYGQSRTPHAMFSRSLAGTIGDCMVLALPGSTRGAMESMEAIFPHILHTL
ncbi:bifunctional molybdenum cofactor biosynthesis protein MoaC/MoaB [Algoriphagus sp. A40]|uniref:bifunctional molybdenum cofactor biosynthesis protein MoaC/MoaB n=1 Tax=Algoriphagus sp. A40 TaxID=1945863 RepID=UPI0009853654|nr:bifunctional molybdenum cofactor biosynthesis protein MoaC/MoaB [Algoriphagus sp. A40]OOG76515.1 bifunctional molybdenum cofactor biosynthesis protein MoaC/MoaB [Algoriphagus sp. A40]